MNQPQALSDHARRVLRALHAQPLRRAAFELLTLEDPEEARALLEQRLSEVERRLDEVAARVTAPDELLRDLPVREVAPGEPLRYEPSTRLPG